MARKKRGDVATAAQGTAQPAAATTALEPVVGNSPKGKVNGADPTGSPVMGKEQNNGFVGDVLQKIVGSPMGATLAAAAAVTARPQVDTTNMSASQKKNLKKKIRKQEQRQQEAAMMAAVRVDGVVNSASHYAEQESALRRRLEAMKRSAAQPRQEGGGRGGGGVKKMIHELETLIHDCDAAVERETGALQKPLNKRLTVAQLQQQVRDVEMQVQKQQKELQKLANQSPQHQEKGGEWPTQAALEESLRYLAHLREQLMLTQQQSDLRGFQERVGTLKSECEAFLKSLSSSGSGRGGGGGAAAVPSGSPRESQWRRRLGELTSGGRGGGGSRRGGNKGANNAGDESHVDQTENLPPLITQQIALGADAMSLLFPGGQNPLLVRKVERGSGAIIDRQSGGSGRAGTVMIVGLQNPSVEQCAAVLTSLDEGMQPDKKEKYRVSVSGRSVGSVIGSGGSNLRKIEEECDVIVWAEGTEMIVMGASPSNIAKGLQQLKDIIASPLPSGGGNGSGSSSSGGFTALNFDPQITRAVASPAFRSLVRDIESSCQCSVRLPKAGAEGVILVQSSTEEGAAAGAKRVADVAGSLVVRTVQAPNDKMLKLLKGNAPSFSPSAYEMNSIAFIRGDGELLIVGPSSPALEEAMTAVEEGLSQVDRIVEQVRLTRDQSRLLTRARRGQIEEKTGVTFRPPRPNHPQGNANAGDLVVSFIGSETQVRAAKEMVETLLREEGHSDSLMVGREMTAALLADRGQGVRDLEEKFGVRVSIDRMDRRAVVRGSSPAVHACMEELQRRRDTEFANEKEENFVTERFPIRKDQISVIIGRQGARIRKLQIDSGVDSMRVDDGEGVVIVRGTSEAVSKGVQLIEEALQEEERGANGSPNSGVGAGEMEGEEGDHSAGAYGSQRGRGRRGGRGGMSSTTGQQRGGGAGRGAAHAGGNAGKSRKSPQKPLDVDASDNIAFPSLGAAVAVEAGHRHHGGRGRGWRKGGNRSVRRDEDHHEESLGSSTAAGHPVPDGVTNGDMEGHDAADGSLDKREMVGEPGGQGEDGDMPTVGTEVCCN
ncbi:kh domain-containing [Cystoisospora suis]|uniref:Kh domain-containing n=1 Tax=Cystoisospora suis TaxID=483139 RepID=A0A2C6KWI9_9APIC|nr:kh domain-containing [Cystoisospora suis]